MFHARDGWFFRRIEENGNVVIEHHKEAKEESPLISAVVFTPEIWASVVASVSEGGENDGRWYRALDFHNGREKPTTSEELRSALSEKERGDRLEAMVDRMAETISECVLLIWPMYDLIQQIEICGASTELTKAVTMAGDIMHKLMDATGAKQLPPKRSA